MYQKRLSQLKDESRYRSLTLPGGIDLTSNDYLGMASHPALRRAAIDALEGGIDIGAAGSRLLRGHTQAHFELEDYAAKHFSAPNSLYFSSGFMANYALLTALPERADVVLYDAWVHASTREGIRAIDAKAYKFFHNDLNALEEMLRRYRDVAKRIWITIESVYSMDGDFAPLDEIYDLAERYDAIIIIDEAHGTGVYGKGGRGMSFSLVEKYGYERLIILHTCGKAIGVAGGLVCASSDVIEFLINTSRPFIYSTAVMPVQSIVVKKALEILVSDEGDVRRERLFSLCARAKGYFSGAGSQIIPIMLYDEKMTIFVAGALQNEGFDIRAIRPPTVPKNGSRLRLSLSSELEDATLDTFFECYSEIMKKNEVQDS